MAPFVFVILLAGGFMALLVVSTGLLIRTLRRSDAPVPRRVLGGALGGIGIAIVGSIGVVALLGTLGLVAGVALIEHGPIRSIEVLRLEESGQQKRPDRGGFDRHRDLRSSVDAATSAFDSASFDTPLEARAIAEYEASTAQLDPEYPVHVLVEYRGDIRLERLHRWLDRQTHGDVVLLGSSAGAEPDTTLLDFGLDVSYAELEYFERDFESAQPFFDLPQGIRLDITEP